jgi:hypothetical protein
LPGSANKGRLEVDAVNQKKKNDTYLWGPLLVHPFDWPAGRLSSPGVRIRYPKMEATKESTRITTARIRGIC